MKKSEDIFRLGMTELKNRIERGLRLGMNEKGTYLTIEYIYGFELFNTRPYHCYETWCGGWRVTDKQNNIVVQREELDDAINTWASLVTDHHATVQFQPTDTSPKD